MFQYIKRNILRRGVSPNNDFGFLADQLPAYLGLTLAYYLSLEMEAAIVARLPAVLASR